MRPIGRPVNPGTIYNTECARLKLLPPTSSFAPIIIIIIIIVSFMQAIHTHIPETNLGDTLLQLFFFVYGASISSSCVGFCVLLR